MKAKCTLLHYEDNRTDTNVNKLKKKLALIILLTIADRPSLSAELFDVLFLMESAKSVNQMFRSSEKECKLNDIYNKSDEWFCLNMLVTAYIPCKD